MSGRGDGAAEAAARALLPLLAASLDLVSEGECADAAAGTGEDAEAAGPEAESGRAGAEGAARGDRDAPLAK